MVNEGTYTSSPAAGHSSEDFPKPSYVSTSLYQLLCARSETIKQIRIGNYQWVERNTGNLNCTDIPSPSTPPISTANEPTSTSLIIRIHTLHRSNVNRKYLPSNVEYKEMHIFESLVQFRSRHRDPMFFSIRTSMNETDRYKHSPSSAQQSFYNPAMCKPQIQPLGRETSPQAMQQP